MNTKSSFRGISHQAAGYDAVPLSGLFYLPISLYCTFRIGVSQ
jgi:hypothetical protein